MSAEDSDVTNGCTYEPDESICWRGLEPLDATMRRDKVAHDPEDPDVLLEKAEWSEVECV